MSSADDGTGERYFFVHVRKTGGTSFDKMLRRVFPPESCYPTDADVARNRRTYPDVTPEICDFIRLPPDRLRGIRLVSGHYPPIAGRLLPEPPRYLTFLRHPMARTISHLRHARHFVPQFRDLSLSQILELRRERELFFRNHQTLMFSYRSMEEACRVDDVVVPDRSRLQLAKETLVRCDFVGIFEFLADSIRLCECRFGWDLGAIPHEQRSPAEFTADTSLEERIRPLVELDLELYEFACGVFSEMRARYVPR